MNTGVCMARRNSTRSSMFIEHKPRETYQNSFRSSMVAWLKGAWPHYTPKGVRGPNLIDPAINIQPLRGCFPLPNGEGGMETIAHDSNRNLSPPDASAARAAAS